MTKDSEIVNYKKITYYEPELYAIHYKGKPFSIGNLSYSEQIKLGIRYLRSPNITRKIYFSKRSAKSSVHYLPEEIRDKIEIVKYVPENFVKNEEFPLFNNQ